MLRTALKTCPGQAGTLLFKISRNNPAKFPSTSQFPWPQTQIRCISFDLVKFITGTSEMAKAKKLEIGDTVDKATELWIQGESCLRELNLINWWDPTSILRIGFETLHLGGNMPMWASILTVCCASEIVLWIGGIVLSKSPLYQNQIVRIGHKMIDTFSPVIYTFAVARMNYADYPGLNQGGILWFTDLTTNDPLFLLPAIYASIYFVANYYSARQRASYDAMKWEKRMEESYDMSWFTLNLALSLMWFGLGVGVSSGADLGILAAKLMMLPIAALNGDYAAHWAKKLPPRSVSKEYKSEQEKLIEEMRKRKEETK